MWEQVYALVTLLIFTNTLSCTESTLNVEPHWVKYNPDDGPLPADAIVGGYGGHQNETLYIARAPHVGSLTPGKYVPSTHQAVISWGWLSHNKTEFEILCGRNYKWVPTTTDNIPEGVVVGGYIQDSYEPLYVGRVHYSGQILPGKVAVSHGVLYFGYEDREIDVKNFEILVKITDSSSDDYPHWVKFNPANDTLPADAIVGGYEDETLYIARAPYVGSLTPGKYVPSTHQAVISWGWSSHVKNEFEILCGRNYKWVPTTTDNIPDGAVVGGYIQNSYEPLYVGRIHYKGHNEGQVTIPGKVAVSHKVMYFAYGDKEIDVKFFEILVKTSKPAPREYPHWVKYNPADGLLPADAIVGGYGGHQNETLYIARAPHVGSLTPGKYVPSTHQAIISWGWWSHVKTEFEILVGHNYKWVPTTVHYIPDGAVVGGYIQDSYEPLFVGRAHYADQILPGKVAVSHGVLYFGYKDREIDILNFEILVFNDEEEEKPKITGEYNVTATIGQTVNIECQITKGVPRPTIRWFFRPKTNSTYVSVPGSGNMLNISNVETTDAGTYKCVATNDVGNDEHLTELVVQETISDANTRWVKFNPATDELPADAIVGGYEHEPLYIARAPHEGSLSPGMYVPSTHKAYVTWSTDAHPKTVFEILCGRNYEWVTTTTHYIPNEAVVGGYIENSYEVEYVGRVNFLGQVIPGKVAVSHGVLYFAYEGRTMAATNFQILVNTKGPILERDPHWVKYDSKNNKLPDFAILGGYENEPMFIARAPHEGSLTPGKFRPSTHEMIISWGGVSYTKNDFEILCGLDYEWILTTTENIPDRAFVAGYIENSHEPLFVGRSNYLGEMISGKVAVSHGGMYLAYDNREIKVKHFEILTTIGKRRPTIKSSQSEIATTIGQSVNITCRVLEGKPVPTISWQFRSRTGSSFVSIPVYDNMLHISNVDETDAGTYKCVATNEIGEDEALIALFVQNSTTISDPNPHWVLFDPVAQVLPADAIVGGYQNEPLYIARAPHEGSLSPGMYVPSTHKAYVTWSTDAHPKTVFEILCGRNYMWVPTTTDNIPNDAVVGGYIENSYETEYIGRTNYSGYVIPGKVAVSHGVLYFAYEGRTTAVRNFEILVEVKPKKPVITGSPRAMALTGEFVNIECMVVDGMPNPKVSWQFKAKNESSFVSLPGHGNLLRLSNVNPGDAGTYKCIATNDVGNDEHLTELVVPKNIIDPHWMPFNPDVEALPTDATVGGYKDETLYIAVAEHEESMIPGMYAPSEHKAYITWGNYVHAKNITQILRGDNYIWVPTTTDYIPDIAFRGGYLRDRYYEPVYVCRANYSGHVIPGRVAVSQGACYIAHGGERVSVTIFEVLVVPEKRAPRITGKERETVIEGHSVNIKCTVTEGIPEPTISWEFKPKSGLKFVPVPGSDNVLRITRADETDAGTYKCIASNDLGYEMHRTELIVQTILEDYGTIYELDLFRHMQDSISRLKCGSGNPSETISWFNNGVSAGTNGVFFILRNLDMSYEGHNYTCQVTDGNATEVHTFVLIVSRLQFTIDREDPIFIDLTDRENFELNCDFVAKAPAKISWTFNGELMDNQNSSRLTFIGNWGTYTCKVTDIDGTIQRSFNVTSSSTKCIIPRKSEYDNSSPFISSVTGISDYSTGNLKVEPGQTLIFSCPNFKNRTNHFQMFPLRNKIKAQCVKGDQFIVKDKTYKLSDLVCAQEVQVAIFNKHQKCWTNNNNSELLGVGFGFIETLEVCFDTANKIPLYIPGKISKDHDGEVTYNWYKYPALEVHRDMHTCDHATSTCCYTKAQLVNARDVSAGPSQRTTFIDPLNAVMVWRPCDLPQSPWEVMESSVRMLTALKDEFKVWSGTYMPQNMNGTVVPRYLWKAVEKTIALIYINDPTPVKEDILCTNICGTSPPWPSEYKQYIYCCNLEDFLVRFGLEATNVGEPLPGGIIHHARLFF